MLDHELPWLLNEHTCGVWGHGSYSRWLIRFLPLL